jgi:hypothetical protein
MSADVDELLFFLIPTLFLGILFPFFLLLLSCRKGGG